jgi:hypothetical protein
MGLKLWDEEGMVKAIRAARKKEVVYFVASMIYNLSSHTLCHYVQSNWNFLKPPSQNLGVSQYSSSS